MESLDSALKALRVDALSIRLDCDEPWLREHSDRFALCGVHLATDAEIDKFGYLENAVVPNPAVPLDPFRLAALSDFLAVEETHEGLCLRFGKTDLDEPAIDAILREAAEPGFTPHHGADHRIGGFTGRLIDVLRAEPGSTTTTVLDPRITQFSEDRQGNWMGMHYDNALTKDRKGERFGAGVRLDWSDRRLLCNVGPGPRHLVVALTMTALHLAERVSPGDLEFIPDSRRLQALLRDDQDAVDSVVCLVCTLDPGDFAVFPAGVAIHDGSMAGLDRPSRAIVLGGRFPR